MANNSIGVRLDRALDKSGGPDACWPFQASRSGSGYGTIHYNGEQRHAHAVALELHTNEPAAGRYALHSCDNRPCCNPVHLRWGTPADNMKDQQVRGANGSKTCPECELPVANVRSLATFCSAACRHAFNNRRAQRGAALYDLWMAHRYDRGLAKLVGCFALMCALGQDYRKEDAQRRGHGWRSWLDPETVLAHRPWLKSKVTRL